jgi:thiosulfate/3-mercaptopyruvate sulfurtransferase
MTAEVAERTGRDYLVSTDWLARQIDEHGDSLPFVLIDAGEAVAYRRVHIPGAVGVPHPYLKGEGGSSRHVMDSEEFEAFARRSGISNDTPVIVYDDNASLHAARVWWVFRHHGHHDVRVVDGGLNAWLDEGRALTSMAPRPEPGSFTSTPDDSCIIRADEVRGAIGGDLQIWDTRSPEEWDGTNDRGNARSGHVPGAIHLDWRSLTEGPPGRHIRPLDEIRSILEGAGINPEAQTVSY